MCSRSCGGVSCEVPRWKIEVGCGVVGATKSEDEWQVVAQKKKKVPLNATCPKTLHCEYARASLRHSVTIFGCCSVDAVWNTRSYMLFVNRCFTKQ